jgi:hypothetical protein
VSGVRTLNPRSIAITDQILATLAADAPLPVTTNHVWRTISPYRPRSERLLASIDSGQYVPYSEVLRLLNLLARRGEIEKWPANEDRRSCLWRWLTIPEEVPNG